MEWSVLFADEFEREFFDFPSQARREIFAVIELLRQFGPHLGRPHVDTLKGAKHTNMKEARFKAADGAWRLCFAFDPKRRAILLVAGDKSGSAEKRFYRELIHKADQRFATHLRQVKREDSKHGN